MLKEILIKKIETYMNYKNEHSKVFEKENEDQFDEYRKKNVDEKNIYQ